MRHSTSRRIERRIKAHADNGIAQHVANLLYTVEKQGKPEIWRDFLNLQQSAGLMLVIPWRKRNIKELTREYLLKNVDVKSLGRR